MTNVIDWTGESAAFCSPSGVKKRHTLFLRFRFGFV